MLPRRTSRTEHAGPRVAGGGRGSMLARTMGREPEMAPGWRCSAQDYQVACGVPLKSTHRQPLALGALVDPVLRSRARKGTRTRAAAAARALANRCFALVGRRRGMRACREHPSRHPSIRGEGCTARAMVAMRSPAPTRRCAHSAGMSVNCSSSRGLIIREGSSSEGSSSERAHHERGLIIRGLIIREGSSSEG